MNVSSRSATESQVPYPFDAASAASSGDATWQWQTWEGLPYLTCSLLEPWSHGFFTRSFGPRPPEHLVEALCPSATVYRVKQVHGNTVLKTTEINPIFSVKSQTADPSTPETYFEADGLLTSQGLQSVWVCTADCVPVLIGDLQTGQAAAIHAGWRGTAAKIVPEAIQQFLSHGSQIANLRVVMGPAIQGEVYQVSTEVAAQVGATIAPEVAADSQTDLLNFLFQLPSSPLLADPTPDKVRLDVRRVNALQLEQLGLQPEQVAVAPYCTYQKPDYFCSYRRDQLKKVQWSGVVSWN